MRCTGLLPVAPPGIPSRAAWASVGVRTVKTESKLISLRARRWVIRFLGGAWCWDAPSCATRWVSTPYLMSTLALPPVTSATAHVDGLPDVVLQVPPARV